MPRLLLRWVVAAFIMAAIQVTAAAAVVEYALTSIGGAMFAAQYRVAAGVTESPISEFSIFFDGAQYAELHLVATPPGWDSLVLQPDAALAADGVYDSLALSHAIAPGASLSGFTLQFRYLGAGLPGPQRFEILDSRDFSVLDAGYTTLVSSIPEPARWQLLLVGLVLGLIVRSIWPHRPRWRLWSVVATWMMCLLAREASAQETGTVDAAPPGVSIAQLIKTGESRVSRTVYRYRYQLALHNNGAALKNVRVQLSEAGDGTVIVAGLGAAGDMVAGASATTQDIVFEHDRLKPFVVSALHWRVIADPPGALGRLDYDAALAGSDANANGIRDDIEAVIAELLPEPAVARAALSIAASLQQQVADMAPAAAAVAQTQLEQGLACLAQQTSDYARIARTLFVLAFNTQARLEAHLRHMAQLDSLREVELSVAGSCNAEVDHAD